MRLVEFKGSGIRGYQEHHIQFRDSITFLIGINGSGKTTVLNLIQGLLRPSYRILDKIEFDHIEVLFRVEADTRLVRVCCDKDKDSLVYNVLIDGVESKRALCNRFLEKDDDTDDTDSRNIEEKYSRKCKEFEEQEACRIVANYKAPMFLTLDRVPQNVFFSDIRHIRFHELRMRNIRGNIDRCLVTIQDAIYEMMRFNASKQNDYVVNLRNDIVKESLSFMEENNPANIVAELDSIQKREHDFLKVMEGLDIPGIKEIASDFFSKFKDAVDKYNSDRYPKKEKLNAISQIIYNQALLKRVEKISKLGHEYQEKVAELQEPMNRFVQCVNIFFEESQKNFVIDSSGKMQVICSNGMSEHINNVTELSSGEKQIVAMLGSLIFLQEDCKPEVYFIDEPEVSLHLSWQDKFVDALLKACPQYQFVLATHSPNIIAKEERRSWSEDLSPKFLKYGVR